MGFKWPITVYYEDTDAGGIVYHANYLKFFERARTEWLLSLGISQKNLLDEEIGFVVKKMDIDFCQAGRFEQKLIVDSRIKEFKKTALIFEQKILDADKILCYAEVVVVCVSLVKMKPVEIPSYIVMELERAD